MGNITKEQKELRQHLKKIKFLRRDYSIYTILEKETDFYRIPYYYSYLCQYRAMTKNAFTRDSIQEFMNELDNNLQNTLKKILKKDNNRILDYEYYLLHLIVATYQEMSKIYKTKDYYITYEPYHIEKFFEEYKKVANTDVDNVHMVYFSDIELIKGYYEDKCNKEISQALSKTEYRTYINKRPLTVPLEDSVEYYPFHTRNAYVEIDFTKSLDELLHYIKKLKCDFDNKESGMILNAHEFLDQKIREPFRCNIKDCEIYDHKSPKSLGGTLADTLYIYDSRKIGLSEQIIKEEINRYWNDVKNIHKDELSASTYKKYLRFARDNIDNNKFVKFATGIN